ncbi:ABC transporter permease [Rhodococcus coprophilus]|uniref:Glycine/betaine ABC transporter integral membrane subunit n=1 Tax=Rhodococcus coprophilus TaxID=38310 RepID=A0A2X4X4D9_9NOCA|nr:ABC transporter permease [Rhodococcus coprophilus]MBM7458947.1 osmoprotectant transport system permease protein [Rhodococcus coprophilus]SQI34305.1 glycine/betaine ABC transporter integral membrane subunit [Rhodococcus coprophilus]
MNLRIPGYLGTFWELLSDHLVMALGASFLGLVVALPLGLVCVRWPRAYPPVLAISSVLYSIPSLAFFVLLIAFTGISRTTVILPLAVYALAGLVPNVVDGLRGVPDSVRQSAIAMGFSEPRRLLIVDLPIALPAVLAGLRVAVVANISLVSVGALIGMGAFGSLFTASVQLDRLDLALIGVAITVVMALVADAVLVLVQWLATPWLHRSAGATR